VISQSAAGVVVGEATIVVGVDVLVLVEAGLGVSVLVAIGVFTAVVDGALVDAGVLVWLLMDVAV
jgi:hypothetical protein